MNTYLQQVRDTVAKGHRCEAVHVATVPVREVFKGQTVWDGEVEVFDLNGHPKAKKCYAWGYRTETGEWEYVTVLEIPPVDSAKMAVKIAIAAEAKSKLRAAQ